MLWAAVVLMAYLGALLFRSDRIPAGLNNDVAEEALRGLYLVNGRHFEVITFAIGNSAETLYLYLMGAALGLLGPTTFALHLLSWIFAIACIWMIWKLAERITDGVPAWIPLLTAACSIWLFHYARTGLRAISAPFFLCAFALLLDRVERRPADRGAGLICGAVLGLGIYGYTSARVLPIAFVLYVAYQMARESGSRAALLRRYMPIAAGACDLDPKRYLLSPATGSVPEPRQLRADGLGRRKNNQCRMDGTVSVLLPGYLPIVSGGLSLLRWSQRGSDGFGIQSGSPGLCRGLSVRVVRSEAMLRPAGGDLPADGVDGVRDCGGNRGTQPDAAAGDPAGDPGICCCGIRPVAAVAFEVVDSGAGPDSVCGCERRISVSFGEGGGAGLLRCLCYGDRAAGGCAGGAGAAGSVYRLAGRQRDPAADARDGGAGEDRGVLSAPAEPGRTAVERVSSGRSAGGDAPVFSEFTAKVPPGSRAVEERFTSITLSVR